MYINIKYIGIKCALLLKNWHKVYIIIKTIGIKCILL